MSFANPTSPNLPDFKTFAYEVMQINLLYLPTDSPFFAPAFYRARNLVINVPCINGWDYTDAVYNCGGHILVRIAQDQPDRGFFAGLREKYGMLHLAAGLVASTSDASTSTTLAVPDSLAQLTISDLGFMKTPWGRVYLEFNQDFGNIWGLS